jgi:hypothetical protein
MQFELYREKFRITEWKDGAIFKTVSEGCEWYDEEFVKANRPRESNLMYIVPSTTEKVLTTIRIKKE